MLGWKATNIAILAMQTFVFAKNINQGSIIEGITYATMLESGEVALARILPADISHFMLGNSAITAGRVHRAVVSTSGTVTHNGFLAQVALLIFIWRIISCIGVGHG
jgi:hypothetical protein